MPKLKYYHIKILTPSNINHDDFVAICGSNEEQILYQIKEIATHFLNNIANYEYNVIKQDMGYSSYENYLEDCSWSVYPVSKTRYNAEKKE